MADFEARKAEANAAYTSGNFNAAIMSYTSLIDLMHDGKTGSQQQQLKVLFSNRSAALHKTGRFGEAMVDAKACIGCDAEWSKGHLRLGDAASALGMWGEACKAYQEARRLDTSPNAALDKKLEDAEEEAQEQQASGSSGGGQAPTILPYAIDALERVTSGMVEDLFGGRGAFFHAMQNADREAAHDLRAALALYVQDYRNVQQLPGAATRMREAAERAGLQDGDEVSKLTVRILRQTELAFIEASSPAPSSSSSSATKAEQSRAPGLSQTMLDRLATMTKELMAASDGEGGGGAIYAAVNHAARVNLRTRREILSVTLHNATPLVPSSPETARLLVAKAHLAVGKALMNEVMSDSRPVEGDSEAQCRVVVGCQMMQLTAAAAAWCQGGWKKCADALGYRGAAFFLRGQTAEAAKDLCHALNMPAKRWIQAPFRGFLEAMLSTLHRTLGGQAPSRGNYLPLPCSGLAGRYAAASVQIGTKLYVFGGLRTKPVAEDQSHGRCQYFAAVQQLRQTWSMDATDVSLNDLVCFDFRSNTWSVIDVIGLSPPPRMHGVLAAHPSKADTLLLLGGHQNNASYTHMPELWEFSLATRQWRAAKMKSCPLKKTQHIVGHVMIGKRWFIVTPGDEGDFANIYIIDLQTAPYAWARMPGGHATASTWPRLANRSGTSFWIKETQKLYLWARGEGDTEEVRPWLWAVELKGTGTRVSWSKLEMGREKAGPNAWRGHVCHPYGEASCCVDQASQRAYIFGGWHDSFNQFSVDDHDGSPRILDGRYSNVLVELDVKRSTVRVVQAAGTKFGPSKRGWCVMGMHNGRVLICGGYTTLDAKESMYRGPRHLSDEWIVTMLPDEEVSSGGSGGGGAGSSSSPSSGSGSGSGSSSDHDAPIVRFDIDTVCENAMRAPLHDMSFRVALNEALPPPLSLRAMGRDRPMLLINCMNFETSRLLPLADLFQPSNMHTFSLRQVLARFPSLEVDNPVPVEQIVAADTPGAASRCQIHVLYFCDCALPTGGTLMDKLNQAAAEGKPVKRPFQWGFYGRPLPGVNQAFFFQDNKATESLEEANGPFRPAAFVPSGDTQKARDPSFFLTPEGGAAVIKVATCHFPQCPNAGLYRQVAMAAAAGSNPVSLSPVSPVKPPKLMQCARCLLVKYCSTACQRADYADHKAACNAASAGGGSSKKSK